METLKGRLGQMEMDGLGLLFVDGPKSFNITLDMFGGGLSLEEFVRLEGREAYVHVRDGKAVKLELGASATQ